MNVETIKTQLEILKLRDAAAGLGDVLEKYKKAVSLNWLSELLVKEIDGRKEKALQYRIQRAEFPEITTIEGFDWKFNPKIDREKIEELATLNFMKQNEIALFLGNTGTGKTHIALAIGIRAVNSGYRVYCSSLKKLSQQILAAKSKNTLDILFRKILASHLWIIDDWGVVTMNREVAEEVFDLFDRRKHCSAMILTSNRAVEEWGALFPDPIIANATVDRIFDRAEILTFKGDSYRLKKRIKIKEIDIKEITK